FNLEAEGYGVDIVDQGETALERLSQDVFDLVVLDVMLPGMDGFAVASELRRSGNFVPILMLTARGRAEDILKGFEAGADDYLPKPFELSILIARIRGLLRRHQWLRKAGESKPPEVFSFNGRVIDFDALQVSVGDKVLPLTLMEADLLRYLIRHQGKAVSRKMILEEVWNVRDDTDTRAIDNFIVRLRRYIEQEPSRPSHLLTVRGVGYRFVLEPERSAK
ncbi:MAG TPA: response regulator transcription factor, partial [Bryobacteraceae bacterium]|nr:response regulator transcription factor [Bryobacteraceae bacterium]